MKAQRTGIYPDLRTKYIADAFKNTSSTITEMSGELPLAFVTTGLPLTNYKAYGNAVQAATPSPDNPVEVQAVGDKTANLINANAIVKGRLDDGVLGYASDTTELIVSGNVIKCTTAKAWRGFVTDFIPVEQGRYYLYHIMNPNDISYAYRVDVYDSQKKFVRVTTLSERTITINEGEAFIRISYQLSVAGTFEISNIMLNAGSTPLPYEPYGYKIPFTTAAEDGTESITTTVYLDKPLYSDDILSYSEQKVTRGWGVKVFDGTENITRDNSVLANCFAWSCPSKKTGSISVYSSHFLSTSDLPTASERGGKVFASRSNTNIGFGYVGLEDIIGSTVAEFKSYLAEQYANGTPVKVWYVLQTPETESVELPKLPTLDGVTVIDAATTIKPSKMDIKYTALNLLMFSREG